VRTTIWKLKIMIEGMKIKASDLRNAHERGRFVLHPQPQVARLRRASSRRKRYIFVYSRAGEIAGVSSVSSEAIIELHFAFVVPETWKVRKSSTRADHFLFDPESWVQYIAARLSRKSRMRRSLPCGRHRLRQISGD